jgi:hypothetical protein
MDMPYAFMPCPAWRCTEKMLVVPADTVVTDIVVPALTAKVHSSLEYHGQVLTVSV